MAQIAHRSNASHARATLQCVQMAFELFHRLAGLFITNPGQQGLVGRFKELRRFLRKYRSDLGVVFDLFRRGLNDSFFKLDADNDLFFLCGRMLRLHRGCQIAQMIDQRCIVRALAFGLVDVADDCGDRTTGRF